MDEVRFCFHRCRYLNPTEEEQTDKKEAHICELFNKRVYHGGYHGYHPHLIRLPECDLDFFEAMEISKEDSEFLKSHHDAMEQLLSTFKMTKENLHVDEGIMPVVEVSSFWKVSKDNTLLMIKEWRSRNE